MHVLELVPIGDSLGFILPPELVKRLHLDDGTPIEEQALYLTPAADGYILTSHATEAIAPPQDPSAS